MQRLCSRYSTVFPCEIHREKFFCFWLEKWRFYDMESSRTHLNSLLFLHAKAAAHTHIRAAFSTIRAKQLRLAAGAVFAHPDLIRRDPHQLQLFLIDSFDVDMAFAVYHVFRRSGDVIFCKRPVSAKASATSIPASKQHWLIPGPM